MNILILICIVLIIATGGCVKSNAPNINREFLKVKKIDQFVGIYQNQGNPLGLLSSIILSKHDNLQPKNGKPIIKHEDIDFIQVKEVDGGIKVEAVLNECVAFGQSYFPKKDFTIQDGAIVLNEEFNLLTRGSQDIMLGPSKHRIVLGLDTNRDGKFKNENYMAGLVYLFVPVAGKQTLEVTFKRMEDAEPFSQC